MNIQSNVVSLIICIMFCNELTTVVLSSNELIKKLQFPKNFMFGVRSDEFQTDRIRNSSGREGNIQENTNNGTSDVTSGNTKQTFRDNIASIKTIGFGLYRFSLSWPWILPYGTTDQINCDGLNYYKDLVAELVSNKIEPMVVLHEEGLPERFQRIGGWLNPLVVEHFEQYARLMFTHLGPKVKWWITINKPIEIAEGYGSTKRPPTLNLHGFGEYLACHNLLRAHSRAYRIYKKEFASSQGGKVSINIKGDFVFPAEDSEEGLRAAETALQFSVGWFGHPVYSHVGDYPPVMRDYITRNSAIEALKKSRLPYFGREEMQQIRGSFDFLDVTHSTSFQAVFSQVGPRPSWQRDSGVKLFFNQDWPFSDCPNQKIVPEGIRRILKWLRDEYGDIPTFVTENGYCDKGKVQDDKRVAYYEESLSEIMKAIKEDNCTVIGYCVRSHIDRYMLKNNLENEYYGLFQVNLTDPSHSRKIKLSGRLWEKILVQNPTLTTYPSP